MRCPKCKTKLVKIDNKRYETLLEHVSNPNKAKFPLREAWKCPNKDCIIGQSKSFFGQEGNLYSDGSFRSKEEWWHAKDSIARDINEKVKKQIRGKEGLK